MTMQQIAIFFLGTFAAGGVVWVFIYPLLTGERRVEQRKENVSGQLRLRPGSTATRSGNKTRREQVEESLKDLENRRKKAKNPVLSVRIQQAGLTWTKRRFIIISAVMGVSGFTIAYLFGVGPMIAAAIAFASAFGMPRWLLSFLKRRRESRFLEVFPDAVDVIVRGIKSGLPLGDCLKMIAQEAQEPVRSEVRTIMETQAVGIPLGDACGRLYERVPLPEANFFGIVIAIQQKSGGNLSEALGNLSRVLRDRKKMKAKIQAMSMEAKASASIIASLPFIVTILVYITSPAYIEMLWTHPTGRMLLAGSAIWMSMGVLVMRKMINFDF